MLDRYKKKGGFIQLLTLIETSGKQKQEQFLGLIAQESPVWEETIKKKTLSIDKILSWDVAYVTEILSRSQPLTVACAMRGMSPERIDKILGCLSQTEKRKIQNMISETNPTPAEVATCVMKIISEVREMMKSGFLKMDKVDPEMLIPENIEDQLQQKAASRSFDPTPEVETPAEPGKLSFDLPPKGETRAPAAHEGNREEVDFLKKKVNTLVSENTQLKNEVSVLRNKLEQIKKIA